MAANQANVTKELATLESKFNSAHEAIDAKLEAILGHFANK